MNYQGTAGQVRVYPIDPNNARIGLDSIPGIGAGGTFNEVTVDGSGRVVSGKFVAPAITIAPAPSPSASVSIDAREGDYGGIEPNWTPAVGRIGLAIDIGALGSNRIWWYFLGKWN